MALIRLYLSSIRQNELSVRAAALAYYATFSLFPLLLLAISVAGFLLDDLEAQKDLVDQVVGLIPSSDELLEQVVRQLVAARAGTGAVGLLGLLWSASGFFGALEATINKLFAIDEKRPPWKSRVIGVFMVPCVALLVLLATASSSLGRLLNPLDFLSGPARSLIGAGLSQLLTLVIGVVAFALLYFVVPSRRPLLKPTLLGALWAALAWGLVTNGLAWYFGSGLSSFNLVYGSVGAIISLTLWLYITNFIVLLGAQLVALLTRRARLDTG